MRPSIDFVSILIGAGGAAAAFFFTGFLREAGKDCYGWLRNRIYPKAQQVVPSPTSVTVKIESDQVPGRSDPKQIVRGHISAKKIVEEVKRVPPLQQKAVIGRFLGMHVAWDLLFYHGAQQYDDRVLLIFKENLSDFGGVVCRVKTSECADLLHADPGAKVRVEGKISDVAMSDVHLEEASIEVIGLASIK